MNASASFLYLLLPVLLLFAVLTAPLDAQPRRIDPFNDSAGQFTPLGEIWIAGMSSRPPYAGLWSVRDTDGDELPDFVLLRELPDTVFKNLGFSPRRGSELLLFRGVRDTVPSVESGKRLGPSQLNVQMEFIGAGDWNGDQHPDIAVKWREWDDSTYGVSGTDQYELFVYWGNEDGEYSLADTTRLQSRGDAWIYLYSGVSADIDLDGVDDLCLQTQNGRLIGGGKVPGPNMSVFRGHKGKRWGRDGVSRRADWEWWYAPLNYRFGEKLIDQNCDNAPDIVMYKDRAAGEGSIISILYGTPGGGMPDTLNFESLLLKEPIPASTVQLIDITGDNLLDLVVLEDLGRVEEQKVRIYPAEPGQSIQEIYGDGTAPWAAFPTPGVLHDGWGGYRDRIWDLGDCNNDGYRDLYFRHYPFFLSYTTGRVLDSLIDGYTRHDGLYPFDYVNVGDISGRGRDAYAVVHIKGVHFIEGGTHIDRHGVPRKLPHTPDVSRCESSVSVDEIGTTSPASNIELRVYPNPSSSRISIEWEIEGSNPDRIEIVDRTGRIVHTLPITEATGTVEWPTDGVPSGGYRVVLYSAHQSTAESVILQH